MQVNQHGKECSQGCAGMQPLLVMQQPATVLSEQWYIHSVVVVVVVKASSLLYYYRPLHTQDSLCAKPYM
jgi:hypothetical protein